MARFFIPRKIFFPALFLIFLASHQTHAVAGGFYSLGDNWEKKAASGVNRKGALEQGFGQALLSQGSAAPAPPPLPVIQKTLPEVIARGGTFEIEQRQSLLVTSEVAISKFIATSDGIAQLETVNPNTLNITGLEIGSTFIHIWDAQGRHTFELRVLQPKFTPSSYQVEAIEAHEKSRSFKIHYDNSRSASYTGDKFQQITRDSLDFTQDFSVDGDTPYGALLVHAKTQKDRRKNIVTDAQMVLSDGKIGSYDNFNLTLGDAHIEPGLMVFPSGRIRGADLYHWSDTGKLNYEGFYGREQSSIIGTLTPGVVAKRTRDSFLSGAVANYQVNDTSKVRAGIFTGHGQSRPDELNKVGAGTKVEVGFGPNFKVDSEVDFDDEKFAQAHALTYTSEKITIRNEFRDISKKFQTLIGAPSRQGELGYTLDGNFVPFENALLSGSLDIFRDRLIPNPDDPERPNVHRELSLSMAPRETTSLLFNYEDLDDTGRLGPTKQKVFGAQVNERFDVWGHKATFFARYQNRGNRVLNNSSTNYIRDQVLLGFHTQIFWGINFSLQKEINRLSEPNIDRLTTPHAWVYTFDYSHRVGDTPFYMDAQLRIRDEENTESINSFMSGEDSVEISGGLYYRETQDMEIFLTGSFANYRPESLFVESPRVEAQFLTGMRYTFDTGYRWSAKGSFEGYVFKDSNGDGVRQEAEQGLGGIEIQTNDGKKAVSDENGRYEFKAIYGKRATLTVDTSKIPYGYAPTSSVQQEVDIIQNQSQRVDFSFTPRSEIAGIVYNDLAGDGRYDFSRDLGVKKVKIILEDGTAARSNAIGSYIFPSVIAGEHTASLAMNSLPDGYLPVGVPKKTFTVSEGIRYELNFPLKAVRLITGRVYLDTDRDGIMDDKEEAMANVKVMLGDKSVNTDAEGWYLFEDVRPGKYELFVDISTLPLSHKMLFGAMEVEITNEPITLSGKDIPIEKTE